MTESFSVFLTCDGFGTWKKKNKGAIAEIRFPGLALGV